MELSSDDLNNINNNINSVCESLPQRHFTSLEINRGYLIDTLSVVKSRYGKCVLTTLYDDDCKFKCFLPNRAAEHLSEDIIKKINSTHKKYTVTYMGQSVPAFKDAKCRALIKFGFSDEQDSNDNKRRYDGTS